MNLTRIVGALGGLVLASGVAGFVVVGCGGDDTNPGGVDSGRDGTTDTGQDVTPSPDTGTDAPNAGDAGDAGDANDGAALPDVHPPPSVGDFPDQVIGALCQTLARCCTLYPDAGAFDLSRCNSTETNLGGFKNISNHRAGLQGDAGALVTYDLAKAGKCLQDIATFTCPPPAQTALEYQTARDDCYAALQGKIALNGAGCTDDIHCAAGHCVGGTCVALVGDGGFCQTSDDCAYRGTSVPNLFCNADGTQDGGVCVPRLDLDGGCGQYNDFDYAACSNGLCDTQTGLCTATDQFIDPQTCSILAVKDAGTD
jgi:hypothetical protein